ncbi:outer membrane protein [Bradyrhizobium ganzhouense]|uniref:outer membrane protein n=1 Tax=Bradyrhizobium ganzhouense TaxID=1179767 RepID=UPI003CEFF4A3
MIRQVKWAGVIAVALIIPNFAPASAADLAYVKSPASTDANNFFYAAIRGGGGWSDMTNLEAINPRVTGIVSTGDQSSFGFGSFALGTSKGLPLRLELEATIRNTTSQEINTVGACTAAQCGASINFNGFNSISIDSKRLMLNAYYDVPINSTFSVFGGAGLGVANLKTSGNQHYTVVQNPGAGLLVGSIWPQRSENNLAGSVTGGVSANINSVLVLETGVRYVDMGRYRTGLNTNLFSDESFSARVRAVEGFGGLRLRF